VAYVERHGAALPDAGALRSDMRQSLPDYMVPATFVTLDALPLTLSGKVDRRALPAPQGRSEIAARAAPRTPTEELLAGIWAQVLELEKVGVDENFFDLGGHSILMMQVLHRAKRELDPTLNMVDLFKYPTINELADHIGKRDVDGLDFGEIDDRARLGRLARAQRASRVMS
jgi:aryl carrier-like protein